MASQKLVRCDVRAPGHTPSASPRYIPLEIFGLWSFLMSNRHGFEVIEPRASLWLDMEDSPEAAYGENQYERVTEVTAFVYSDEDEMFIKVCRYFPTAECDDLKRIFLAHYLIEGRRVQPQVRERTGIWIHRRQPASA
jgi:hypothetical protein